MRAGWVALALAGCGTIVSGEVRDGAGAPVAGAVLHSDGTPACDAVTDEAGRYRTPCAPGSYRVQVTHPGHLPAELPLEVAGRGEVAVAPLVIEAIPLTPGVHILAGAAFVAPEPAPLRRLGSDAEGWRWCAEGAPTATVPAGAVRALDNHVADWRLFRLDADGCAYRLSRAAGDYWEYQADRLEVARVEPLAPGRDWLSVELTPGTYVVADWLASGFVPEGEGWRAGWFRVVAASSP